MGKKLLLCHKACNFYQTSRYQGYSEEKVGQFYVYLLLNDQVVEFGLKVGDEGTSYKYNPQSIIVFENMLESFMDTSNPRGRDNRSVFFPIGNTPQPSIETDQKTYNFQDILQFSYNQDISVELFGPWGVYITDNQPSSVPGAGNVIMITVDDTTDFETILRRNLRSECLQEQFLTGIKITCGNQRSTIYIPTPSTIVKIEYPLSYNDDYQEIINSIELL